MIPIPWKVERGHGCPPSRPWACINESTGHVHGCHPTRESGLKQSAALYANTDETKAASSTPTAGGYGIPQPIKSSIALTGQGSTLTDHSGKGTSMATPDWTVEQGHGCPASAPWAVVDTDTGEVYCCSRSEAGARAQAAVAWDSDAADVDTESEGHLGRSQPMSGGGGNNSIYVAGLPGELRAPPNDIHAGARPRGEDLGFLHNLVDGLRVLAQRSEAHQTSHSGVGSLASSIASGHGEHLDLAVKLVQRVNASTATAAAASSTTGTSGHGQGGGYGAGGSGGGGQSNSANPAGERRATLGPADEIYLYSTLAGVRGMNAHIDSYTPQDPEIHELADRVSSDNDSYMGVISSLLGGGGGSDSGSNYMGEESNAASPAGDPRSLVESVMRQLSGHHKTGDDLSDAEFLYGFTAQLRAAQEAIGTLGSDNPEVKAYAEKAAAVIAEQVAGARRTAWKLSGGKTPAAVSRSTPPSTVVSQFVAAQVAEPPEARTKQAQADRELLESVLFRRDDLLRAMATKSKSGGNKSPYGNVAYADPGYQSDKKKRYPIDTKEHVKAAWSYINQKGNAAKYSSSQVAAIKGRIKSAAKKFGVTISDQSNASSLDAGVYRAVSFAQELRDARDSTSLGLLTGHFSVFDTWYRVDSMREGTFLERVDRSAFDDTIRADRDKMRVLFDHGFDPQLGNKVLGSIQTLRADDAGAYYEVDLFDTSYNRDLLPGLKKGVYGASMRMRVLDDKWNDKPGESDYNPEGIAERTIRKTSVAEFGPVTFPASPSATANVRSMTDYFYERRGLVVPAAEVRSSLTDDGWTADEISEWESHLDTALDSDVSTMDGGVESADFPGRSDAQSVDGGDSETGSRSGRVSTHVDEFSDRIDALWFRDMKMRHASAYQRND